MESVMRLRKENDYESGVAITRTVMQEETEITEKESKKESAMIAPMTGKKQMQPLITFEI